MSKVGIVVEKWVDSERWQYDKEFAGAAILAALEHAFRLKRDGTRVRVYERTPTGPKVVYESP